MNCMNCGASVTRGTEYCSQCGFHVLSQRKAIYLSKLYYNKGLEKASVRDLSGAISCLKHSLKFSKLNIPARNLLGLVYFETGEVVAALCEWVVSKNIMAEDNLATLYIDRLQSNPTKLESINRTINKYNLALDYCRQGHEDMAVIQLRKVLAQNPKLIKGYHLLALLLIKEESYNKARRVLKKAMKIDKTNTTTLRFLREVDEQTGMVTDLSGKTRRAGEDTGEEKGHRSIIKKGNQLIILPPAFRESSMLGICLNLGIGFLIGAAALWFLVIPARTQTIYDTVNKEIQESGGTLSSQAAQIEQLNAQIKEMEEADAQAESQAVAAQAKENSYNKLIQAYSAFQQGDTSGAAAYLAEVQEADLAEEAKAIYQNIRSLVPDTEVSQDGQETTGQTEDGSDQGGYDSGYDDNYDSGYDSDYDSGY